MANKPTSYTANDRAIVDALRNAPEGLTLAGLCEATGLELKPGHVVSAMKKGLIASIGEVTVERPGTREVSTYNFVTADVLTNGDKPFNYTDGEKEVLAAAAGIDSPFTLADLATAMNLDRLTSGRINGLVKKGNITKGDMIEVPTTVKASAKVYGYVKDIPADAE
jgi:hypothetical protein